MSSQTLREVQDECESAVSHLSEVERTKIDSLILDILNEDVPIEKEGQVSHTTLLKSQVETLAQLALLATSWERSTGNWQPRIRNFLEPKPN